LRILLKAERVGSRGETGRFAAMSEHEALLKRDLSGNGI
jgi:hypothetical protein